MKTLGKVAGWLGVVVLLSTPFTYFFTASSAAFVIGKLVAGALLIALFFVTNYRQLGQFASGRSTFFFASSALMAVLALAALAGVNYIAAKKNRSWDLTSKQIHSLAPQTTQLLAGLKQPVRAIGFLAPTHPYYAPLEELFVRYGRASEGRFTWSFEDPLKHPDLAAKYSLKQGQATVVLSRGEGSSEAHTTVNVVSEQELTNGLLKLTGGGERKVYVVAGHGEWPLTSTDPEVVQTGATLAELRRSLEQEGYATESLNLAGKSEVPRDAALVIIAGARGPFAQGEVAAIRQYLDEGGRLLYFAESPAKTGLEPVLAHYGLELDPGLVADSQYFNGSPYILLSLFYGGHEITAPLQQLQLNVEIPTARGVVVLHRGTLDGVEAVPLVLTSPYAWVETTPSGEPQRSSGEKVGPLPLVAVSQRAIPESAKRRFEQARLAVFGDAELLVDANWGHEGNRNLVLNTLGWGTNQVEKVTIRPPDRDISTLEMTPELLSKLHFVATDLLPLTLLGVGLAIWLTRRNK